MFEGTYVAIVTPFKNGQIDEEALRNLVDFLIENKVEGIVPCGTTGESATLSYDEHIEVIKIVKDEAKGRCQIIAGTGSNSTNEAIYLTKEAESLKVDGALLITPYYNKPNQEGLYRHFMAVAKNTKLPIVLYNVPSRTGVNMKPETVARLFKDCENIVAIKEASGDVNLSGKILELTDGKISVLSGDDALTLPLISVGARGVISVTANILPYEVSEMVRYALNGDIQKARELYYKLFKINKVMFIDTNPIPVKTALYYMGKVNKEWRLPLCETTLEKEEIIKNTLKEYGLI
ncbi:MAG TPA: 4-hydroxy-tetrahydrodipicolinate synthase [Desulfurobacteriaceae bacterium]|nr:4-hydroxy-tetrahydrodipicolinate synthase [Desulfurobacteriaceae bacterium]